MTRTLIVSSSLDELEKASLWLIRYLPKSLSESKKSNIVLVVQEMVTNAIIHGNKSIKSKEVFLSLKIIENTSITFTIEDEGLGLSSLPSKEEAKKMDYLQEGGRGLKLAVLLSDDIQIKENKVILVFTI
ncbi:MAG: ATP-binding protein [Sulfurovum sp.]|nr:MAG: ATP-binding protein [Sulfurovum sp.]